MNGHCQRCLGGLLLAIAAGGVGCDTALSEPQRAPTSSTVRADRRLYNGAPPVIPHSPLNIKCVACHSDTGGETPPLGFAPANPHGKTDGLSDLSNCLQCHVFQRGDDVFAQSDFRGLKQEFSPADRAFPGAPPTIPHRVFMRENCNACHSGPVARAEIRCTHPQRSRCLQCHVPVVEPSAPPFLFATKEASLRAASSLSTR